jgi:branched-chain amino acid transport system permease protein
MLGAGVVVALISVLAERLVFHPLRKAPYLHHMIASIGILLFLEAGAQAIWGADFHRMDTPYTRLLEFGGLTLPAQRLLIIGAAFLLVVVLQLFLKKTITGATIVAMAQNREGAALVGIDANPRGDAHLRHCRRPGRRGGATLYAPINLVYTSMGNLVITKAFVIIVLGGMGSVPGAIVGGLIIGFAEAFGAFYISTDYKDIIAFALLVLILSVRPQGLFAKGAH